jgi:hypothetical protein
MWNYIRAVLLSTSPFWMLTGSDDKNYLEYMQFYQCDAVRKQADETK